jgi:hypothetical protein
MYYFLNPKSKTCTERSRWRSLAFGDSIQNPKSKIQNPLLSGGGRTFQLRIAGGDAFDRD